ncbi:MAG: efflux RND transporter periplasmic adaptor subunit [Anaerolineae bacterium]
MKRRIQIPIAVILFISLILGGCASFGGGQQADGPLLRTAEITRGDLRELISLTGSLEAARRAELTFLRSGMVEEIAVEPGQRVRAGDRLMRLDTSDLELDLLDAQLAVQLQQIALDQLLAGPSEYDIAAASAAVARAQAQFNQIAQPPSEETVRVAQANLDLARSNLWLALVDRDYIRDANLPQNREIAEKRIDSAELAVAIAQQELANAQQGVASEEIGVARAAVYQAQTSLNRLLAGPSETDIAIARKQIDLAEVALQTAQESLANAEIVAPFDGVVVSVAYSVGEQASAGLPALVMLDDSAFYIDVLVDELDISRVEEGQAAFVALDAFPDTSFLAHVERVAPDAVVVNGITSYEVRLRLEETEMPIRDGMTATVEIVVSELTDVLLVPNWALRFDSRSGQAFASVQRTDGTIEEVAIEVGVRGTAFSEVRGGLKEGDVVAVSLERESLLEGFGPSTRGE